MQPPAQAEEKKNDVAFRCDSGMPFVQSTNHASCLLIPSISINLCAECGRGLCVAAGLLRYQVTLHKTEKKCETNGSKREREEDGAI